MENFPVNPADILVALVLVVSAILAFSRGAVREVLGVGAWIGAAIATMFGFAPLKPYTRQLIEMELIADAVTGLVIFVVALILLTLVSQFIASRIQRSRLGALDRTLGFLFGLVRGAVLLCLAYMLFVWAVREPDRPPWVDQAFTMPYIKQGAETIQAMVPDEVEEKGAETVENAAESLQKLREAERSAKEAEEGMRALSEPVPAEPPDEAEPGYEESERKALDSLTDSVGDR